MNRFLLAASVALAPLAAHAATERFAVMANGEKVGFYTAETTGNAVSIAYDVKDNGRGPTIHEQLTLGADGLPSAWTLDGTSLFGSPVHERYARGAGWTDSTGTHSQPVTAKALYIGQNASPWALGLYARALLAAGGTLPALPAGQLHIEALGTAPLAGATYRAYAISGINLEPEMILLDAKGALFARLRGGEISLREGSEALLPQLEALRARLEEQRYAALQAKLAHHYAGVVRLRNVRVFDPVGGTLGAPVSVTFADGVITGVQPLDAPATPGETLIDGQGGTVLPGLHDMHAHVSLSSALLYIAAGVTSVRDMGNDNAFLADLRHRIDSGALAGPTIVPNGFLEGRSPYSARNGFVVDSQDAALDAVRWYAARGYWQIKIYNSMNPAWVPAITHEAHRLGMTVTGHIPAFTNADAMIAAGYDEVTHINQLMLGWVLDPKEDTRTPLRLTAMRRTAGLDLSSPRVQATLDTMQARHIAHDPTAVTLELLMLSRDGKPSPAVAGYLDHMPIGVQRDRLKGIAPIAGPEDDAAYRGAFDKIKALLLDMDRRGIRLMPGTDDGTGLSVHRELQIYTEAGLSPAEALRLDTLGADQYMARDQHYGSVARGKAADFILLPGNPLTDMAQLHRIAMVVKGGTVYFPSEIYPAFGVKPFADAPKVTPGTPEPIAGHGGGEHDAMDEFLF